MSSKILLKGDLAGVTAIQWRRTGNGESSQADLSTRATMRPVLGDTAQLHKQIQELEVLRAGEAERAQRQGFAEGEMQGRKGAEVEFQPMLERMSQSVATLAEMRPRLRHEAEADVVQLAIAIARRVLHRELNVDASALQALVQVALSKIDRQEVFRVRVHATQVEPIRSALARFGRSAIDVVADTMCQPGGLIFETNRGQLDASVDTQLEEIARGLADRVRLN